MSLRERGKHKSQRIDLAYHRQRTWLGVARGLAAAAGLLLAGLYLARVFSIEYGAASATAVDRALHLSTGQVASVHASFENDCQKCHSQQIGVAIARDAWQADDGQRLASQEQKCQTCHQVDGHARAMLAHPEWDQDCASCHHEHSGRDMQLSAVADSHCARCHTNLNAACTAGSHSDLIGSITAFTVASHGVLVDKAAASDASPAAASTQFRSLLKDTGRVRFDHAQHLQPGQIDPDQRGGFQLGMLATQVQTAYRLPGQDDAALVQLTCANCHEPYAFSESARKSSVAREEGRYYAPVQFDRHCAACHQLNFSGQGSKHLPLPHVAQREEFAKLIGAKQTSASALGQVTMPGDQATADRMSTAAAADPQAAELLDAKVETSVDAIFERCQQCHLADDLKSDVIAHALAGRLEPMIPQRWLQRGYFDHSAHRRIERCEFCHQMPQGVGPPVDNQRVLISGPQSCVPCHRDMESPVPAAFATTEQQQSALGPKPQPMWSSDDCVKCHRYHWTRPASAKPQSVAAPSAQGSDSAEEQP